MVDRVGDSLDRVVWPKTTVVPVESTGDCAGCPFFIPVARECMAARMLMERSRSPESDVVAAFFEGLPVNATQTMALQSCVHDITPHDIGLRGDAEILIRDGRVDVSAWEQKQLLVNFITNAIAEKRIDGVKGIADDLTRRQVWTACVLAVELASNEQRSLASWSVLASEFINELFEVKLSGIKDDRGNEITFADILTRLPSVFTSFINTSLGPEVFKDMVLTRQFVEHLLENGKYQKLLFMGINLGELTEIEIANMSLLFVAVYQQAVNFIGHEVHKGRHGRNPK